MLRRILILLILFAARHFPTPNPLPTKPWVPRLLETRHHTTILNLRFIDKDTLLVESDSGGGTAADVILKVFDLSRGKLEEILNTFSRMDNDAYDEEHHTEHYTQILNLPRTWRSHGNRFCFVKTLTFENDRRLNPPRVTHPCYKRGQGVDPNDADQKLTTTRTAP